MRERALYWALPLWWAICFALTHVPGPEVPQVPIPYVDKVVHFTMFFGLGALMRLHPSRLGAWPAVAALALLAAYAAIDESTQPLVRRDAELADWVADMCGAAIGMTVAAHLLRTRSTSRR